MSTGEQPGETVSTETARRLAYQPAFDGMRTLGTIAVILAHAAGTQPVLRGFNIFLLVDLFFVVSGYLITTLLLRERTRHGSISLRGFYIRRIARLYPLLLLILAIALIQRAVAPRSTATPSWLAIVSIPGYFTNFAQIIQHDDALNSWGPLWSLSVEEQFYLFWPLVLIVVLGPRFRLRAALGLVATATVCMWAWRSYRWHAAVATGDTVTIIDAWNRFFYSTFQRPDGILIGCAVAIVLALPRSDRLSRLLDATRFVRYGLLAGILAILVASGNVHDSWQVYWGLGLYDILLGLLVIDLLMHPRSVVSRGLGWKPLAWVGRRTYFIYAMHIAFLMFMFRVLHLTSLWAIAAMIVVTIGLSEISYRFYEEPARKWGYRISRRFSDRDHARSTG